MIKYTDQIDKYIKIELSRKYQQLLTHIWYLSKLVSILIVVFTSEYFYQYIHVYNIIPGFVSQTN